MSLSINDFIVYHGIPYRVLGFEDSWYSLYIQTLAIVDIPLANVVFLSIYHESEVQNYGNINKLTRIEIINLID